MAVYKVAEVMPVTDMELEKVLNQWKGEGYLLDRILFAMRESSPRPSMAFVIFTGPADKEPGKEKK